MPRQGKPRIVSIVGARPQFVKLAPLSRVIAKRFDHRIIHSGQHYDYEMSAAFFGQLQIPRPDINLKVGSGSHGRQTGRIMERCEAALAKLKPALVLVYGDTNTTLAGALAAVKLQIPVGHIEAGLRSYRLDMPEEVNRRVTDHISDLLFYPTAAAAANLKREAITKGLVRSGDLMYEILDDSRPLIARKRSLLSTFGIESEKFTLITLHRAENTDNPARLTAFINLLRAVPGQKLFLVHPRTLKQFKAISLYRRLAAVPEVIISSPQPYLETLTLLYYSRAVMTDSGGMQKEAFFLGRPCLTLRPETEWVETVRSGANSLIDLSPTKFHRAMATITPRRRRQCTVAGRRPSEIIAGAIDTFLRGR